MSRKLYSKWWVLTKDQLAQLQKYDHLLKETTKATRERNMANYLVSGLYAKYCMIVQDMDACVDQMTQYQKSVTMRKLMDAAVTRLRELKEMLKEIDLSEIHYVDGALVELKLVPYEIEILDPALMFPRPENIQQMWDSVQKGERLYTPPPPPPPEPEPEKMDSLQRLLNPDAQASSTEPKAAEEKPPEEKPPEETPPEPPAQQEPPKEEKKPKRRPVKKYVLEPKVLTAEEIEAIKRKEERNSIVKLIQTHERARQSRLYFLDRRRVKMNTPRPGMLPPKEVTIDPEVVNKAATCIQSLVKGYHAREELKRRERKRRLLIGMVSPSWRSHEEFDKVQKTLEKRREIVRQHIRDYIDANIKEKDRVVRVVAPGLMEDIGDEIREWFYQWYIRARCFDKIPPAQKGGTALVVRCETFSPEEYLDEVERKRKEKEKLKKAGGGNKAAEEAKKKKAAEEKKKKEEEKKKKEKEAKLKAKKKKATDFEFKFEESPADNFITEGMTEYKKLWSDRKDEDNPEDKVYMDLITEQKCYEIQLEVREKVDELMRIELDLLNDALAYDKAKGKKKKGKKGKKGKKKKGKKGKKGKKKKDITAHRTTEDLFQELVDNGIIRTYPITHLSEFRGDLSYSNWEMRLQEFDPPTAIGDIRQAVALTCILPLGVETLKRRPRSVIIVGPKQSGKHLLANAVFTETKCVLFDLSPPVLAGKYESKEEMKLLVHMINKMSRLLQPSVIYIDGAEKPFYKKVPPAEKELNPKKMGKQLFKGIVKTIKPEDRVLLLGITSQPWAGKQSGLKKAFERVIFIPRTDYGSAYLFLYELLMRYHAVDRDIELSSLAKLAVNYPMGQIKQFVETIMEPRRIIQLPYNPLRQMELYALMVASKQGPVTDKEYKKFTKWYNKTPLGRKRNKLNKQLEKKREADKAAAEKQKGKKR